MAFPRVFVSMGTPYNEKYVQYRDALEIVLRDRCNVDPRIIGKNEHPPGNPLLKIRDVMMGCDGVLIVAYERKFVEHGIERRGGHGEQKLAGRSYTTPWNHVESAMAFALGKPIYIIRETGLQEEGLIETKSDWYVHTADFLVDSINSPAFVDSIRSWVEERVVPQSKKPKGLFSIASKLKLSEMTGEELAIFLTIVTLAFSLGGFFGSFYPISGH
ncbi:MAG: hypothetical protein NT133_00990 [Alphaproteobacteria bacterium]|nr:hypothetical protein [Alphaproteobacteria bacterium]